MLQWWTEATNGAEIVHVRGEVDLATAPMLQRAIEEALARDRHLIVDLSDAEYFDGSGVQALEAAHQLCRRRERMLVVVAPPRSICRRVLEILGLDKAMPIVLVLDDAVAFLRGR